MSDLLDDRMGMLATIPHTTRDQLLRAQAWAETMTNDPNIIREIMSMLAQPTRPNTFSGNNRKPA